MNRLFCVALLFLLCIAQGNSQKLKFGEISNEELLEKEYEHDKSAHAVILYKNRDTYIQSSGGTNHLITEIHERIKIYDQQGFDYATKEVNLFKQRHDDEMIKNIKAVTYNLENGKIVEAELRKDEIFKTEASYNYNQVKFTLPNVKEGSVIEYSYRVVSPFIWNIDEFQFQYDIPVKRLRAEIRTPKGFRFKQTPKGYYNVFPKTTTKRDNRIGMDVVINTYNLEKMPALEEENYVDNIDNYRAGVIFELVSIELPGFYRSYSKSWADVAKTIGNSDDYKNKLDKTKSFDDEIDSIISQNPTKIEKMNAIFKYVKDEITWNGMDGKYFFNGIKKTLKEKKGNVADINLLLVAMLRYAGIDANPVIISTKDNLVPIFPTIDRLNYVLAYAIIDEQKYFMDATEEFSDLNVLPIKDYNWKGILIDNHDMVWKQIDIMSPGSSSNMYALDLNVNEDGSCEGTCKARFDRHSALRFRKAYKEQELESFLTDKEKKLSDIEINDYEAKKVDTYKGAVSESFNFYNDYGADVIDDKLYLKPLGFLSLEENPFKTESREYPVDFGYPFKDVYMVNIGIPEGYKVDFIPAPTVMNMPDKMGSFKYIVAQEGNKITVRVNFEINRAMIAAVTYPYLREFFKQVIAKEEEQLVLSKI
ncbi:transglutaminase domain-containing protein [Flagellimonas sp.]|uniref:transglutaminase domain-containing protein n=1 Tax=Flagellimonas sp. TaxID=2058762 RepID=UPI003B528ACF